MIISPVSGASSRARMRINVVLPEPLTPMRPTRSLQSMPNVTSENSGLLRKSLLRLSAVKTGIWKECVGCKPRESIHCSAYFSYQGIDRKAKKIFIRIWGMSDCFSPVSCYPVQQRMLRLSKRVEYGLVALQHLAKREGVSTVREISDESN